MSYLQGLHGVVAIVLLCSLLFAEEAGVPLPFAPGEVVLMAGGLLIGAAVGLPVEHFLGEVQKLAVQGGILIAMGAGAFVAIRRVPPGDRGTLVRVPDQVRVLLALGVDLGLVASMLSGVVAVVRRLVGAGVIAGWADALVVASGIGIFYLIITRRSTGSTAGEALLRTTYIARHHR